MEVRGVSSTSFVKQADRIKHELDNSPEGKADKSKTGPVKNFETVNTETNEPVSIGELELIKAIEKANKAIEGANRRFEFSIHEKTHTIVVKVINSETDEVIREIPPEKILNMVAKLWEMAGILVDERV